MRFLCDECCLASIVRGLRADGHDVVWAAQAYATESDEFLLDVARRENRIVVTDDLDFGELCVRRALPDPGVILLRYAPAEIPDLPTRMRRVIAMRGERLAGHFTVVMAGKIRFRKLPG